jgi:hypothetical protein
MLAVSFPTSVASGRNKRLKTLHLCRVLLDEGVILLKSIVKTFNLGNLNGFSDELQNGVDIV